MKNIATLILNRNLPGPTDKLVEKIKKTEDHLTDIYVIEAGSDNDKLSKYYTWHVNSSDVIQNGLRYFRGMNYGLHKLWMEDKFENYDAFFLLTNDSELSQENSIEQLINVMNQHTKAGIISPCSEDWGEKILLKEENTKYFWYIQNHAYFLRKEFVKQIINFDKENFNQFLFDGDNFRGYLSEIELIAKAYANDWGAVITNNVFVEENTSYLLDKHDTIKTENFELNLSLYIDEGLEWVHKKYGFNSKWTMQQYVKGFYDNFFQYHPELNKYKV